MKVWNVMVLVFDQQFAQKFLVISMFTALTSLFSHPGKAEEMYPHRIDLSGNVLHFLMPEDFSRDMPAHDIVNRLDISDMSGFDDPQYGNLLRRWWDISESGWFGKRLGTAMMDLSVQRVAENRQAMIHDQPYRMSDQFDLMLMLEDRFHQRYDEVNADMGPREDGGEAYFSSFGYALGDRLVLTQREMVFNDQKWIRQSIGGPNNVTIFSHVIPLTFNVYADLSLTFSPNDNVAPRTFLEIAIEKMNPLLESLRVTYTPDNSFAEVVGSEWLKHSNEDIVEENREKILKAFHHPDTLLPTSAEQGNDRAGN